MRNKDFVSLNAKEKKASYRQFRPVSTVEEHKHEALFRTPRGWFMLFFESVKNNEGNTVTEKRIGEVSVTTAQKWLDECNINFNLGW